MEVIPGGYILQPRSFDKSEASKMPPVARELWFYLLRNVNHADNGKYKRGQGFFCLNEVQDDLCWYVGYRKETYSKPQITKALRRLREGNMIATAKATRGIIVTVENYDKYQDPKNYEGNCEESTKEERRKSGGHTKNKKEKNEEEKKEAIELYRQCFRNLAPPGPVVVEIHSLVDDYGLEVVKEAFIAAGAERKSYTWAKSRMKNRKAEETTSNDIPYFEGYY